MPIVPSPISQVLLFLAFFAVASSAGLQRLGASAQAEAVRQQASRRVVALASYEAEAPAREIELQERLRAEVRGLVNQSESLEAAALGQATFFGIVHQIVLVLATLLC